MTFAPTASIFVVNRADLCVRPNNPDVRPDNHDVQQGGHPGPPLRESQPIFGEHRGSPLGMVVQWFKTMSTNEYIRNVKSGGWPAFEKKLWQRDYWEHIIRNEPSCSAIAEYINNNPLHWDGDSINPANEKK